MADKLLDKVSKILNQAENAGTPEEAEAFMAKAQELAALNALDLAVARSHQAKKEKAQEVEERQIRVNPYQRRHNRKFFVDLALNAIADHPSMLPLAEAIVAKHRCPRCNGVGTTHRPPWVPGDQYTWSAVGTTVYKCSLCQGKGLVDV